jgi:hypothetical protein
MIAPPAAPAAAPTGPPTTAPAAAPVAAPVPADVWHDTSSPTRHAKTGNINSRYILILTRNGFQARLERVIGGIRQSAFKRNQRIAAGDFTVKDSGQIGRNWSVRQRRIIEIAGYLISPCKAIMKVVATRLFCNCAR